LVLLVACTAQLYFGNMGVLFSAVLSGVAGVDAITLSMAELSRAGGLETSVAALAVVLATMSNTTVKDGIVLLGGARPLCAKLFSPALF
jgi:uncharacterized membrane protein (DUF4010 family)